MVFDQTGSTSGLGALAERILGYGVPSPHLERKLKEALGDDAGEELAAVTDRIDPIRGDIAELRHSMEHLEARMGAQIEASAKELTRFFFVAWGVLLAAIVGLYGTMVALLR